MEQKKLVIVLADISGYTRFMVENQTTAVHGHLGAAQLAARDALYDLDRTELEAALSPLIIRRLFPTIVEKVHARGRRLEPAPE